MLSNLKRLYQRILESCHSPAAPYVLGVLSFTESCIFIIPPEVVMLPMAYARRNRAMFYALITTLTSVLGAIAGYYLGHFLWTEIQPIAFEYIPGFAKNFDRVGELFQENAVSALFMAAFTPIPFKVFTVSAGVYSAKISILTVIGTSLVGRGARYFLMAGIVAALGEKAQEFIERHFAMATTLIGILAVAVLYILKFRH